MSSINIIATLIGLLGILVCYAFFSQTVQNKREQRKRILAGLKSRSRTFKFMLNGFPKGFLTKELTMLVQRSLVEVSENLARLEPRELTHKQDLEMATAALANTQRQAPQSGNNTKLETHQQIKEVKMCLEELHRFVHRLEDKGTTSKSQGEQFRNQIKQLVLQVTVDSYILQANTAHTNNKIKLALHYCTLAVNLMIRDGRGGKFDAKLAATRKHMRKLEASLHAEQEETVSKRTPMQEENSEEWDKFNEEQQEWGKKKNIYD